MQILVDADAFPGVIVDILYRAVERVRVPLILVSNKHIKTPRSLYISTITVSAGFDVADDRIVAMVQQGDLVITADIPLADRVVDKGGYAIDPRGELYTESNVKHRLAMRNLLNELRNGGIITGGPSSFGRKDAQSFACQLDRFLTKYCKR
ncbi:MAG: hypothetical protein HW390_349 [Candidatus Brocadiaceae bacterium]|nr:hypothetical protein [Candidatus Brocadiaceae bacterium]